MVKSHPPWEHGTAHPRASELRPGDYLSYQYKVTRVEHGGKPHTVRVILEGGARVTLRDDYRVRAQRASYGGESFFSENKTLHKDDPAIHDLVSVHKDRLHVAEDGRGWDTGAVQRHLRGLQEVPAAHQRFIARSHVEIYVGTEPSTRQDSMGYLSREHPPGYPAGDTWDQCGALFHWPEYERQKKANPAMIKPGTIVLGDTVGSGSVNTAAHETGHALDAFLGEDVFWRGTNGALSMHPDFTGIYLRFRARKLEGYASSLWLANPYYLQEGARGASEAFAEAYAAWVHTASRPSQHRAEEIMDALGFVLTPGAKADPATRRKVLAAKRQMGNDLIAFYDGLDARIRGTVKRLPPPHMKAAAK